MIRRPLAVLLLSAAMFWFGTGLAPMPWLTWLAPLPVLLLAPRVSARTAALVAFGAWFLGGMNMWTYLYGSIGLPAPVLAGYLVALALLFPLALLLGRALMVRGRFLLAVVSVPAAWSAAEYLVSLVSPAGAFWSVAYTQTDVAQVRGIAAVTGMWGISFLIMGASTAVAVAFAPGVRRRLPIAGLGMAMATALLACGFWPSTTEAGPSIALVALEQSEDSLPVDSVEGQRLLARYTDQVRAARTDIVVLPEKVFTIDDLPAFTARFAPLAVLTHTDVVVGIVHDGYNSAVLFHADGTTPTIYHKQHLVPGLEDHLRAGRSSVIVDGRGLVVCKDLDYPALGREYGRRGARLVLVPALDFDRDAWLHSRMAIMRGVESGFVVARSADQGYRTLSDARGEVVRTDRTTLPVGPTPYARLGDWFAWLCLLVALAALRPAVRGHASPATVNPQVQPVPVP